jgi:hypothetical protein
MSSMEQSRLPEPDELQVRALLKAKDKIIPNPQIDPSLS